jgi:cysteine desulfurase
VRVYLDYNATTPVDPRVIAAMSPFWASSWGNPSSVEHSFGWDAADAVDMARGHVADLINARPDEVLFTSCATESVNLALRSIGDPRTPVPWLTTAAEHEAVLRTCALIQVQSGGCATVLPVDSAGAVGLSAFEEACETRRTFVSVMIANNEIGTVCALRPFAEIAHDSGALFFSDITQAIGRIPMDVHQSSLDLAAFSGHKLCGPKGVGALFIRGGDPRINLHPFIVGGRHERGLRAGTMNVPGIVGFGEACRIARLEMEEESRRVLALRDRLECALLAELSDIWINGDPKSRLANTASIGFKGVDARTMIRDMHDIAVSTRSACSSGNSGPSHVLKAIGLSDEDAYSCIRFSLGRFTTEEEIDYTINKVVTSVHKLRRNKSVRM